MKKKRRIISICISFILSLGSIISSIFISVPVCALSLSGLNTTIASVIVSLMLECGVAPVNNSWINTLNTSYGVSSSIGTIQDCIDAGLLTQTATGLVDTGLSNAIESASAYTELGLSEIFTTTVDDAAMGVIAGSGGVNIANTAINVGTLGTIGAFAGASAIGVGLGVLINNVREHFNNYIKYGFPMSANVRRSIAENIPEGYDRCYYFAREYDNNGAIVSNYYFADNNTAGYMVEGSIKSDRPYRIYNLGDYKNIRQISYRNNTLTQDVYVHVNSIDDNGYYSGIIISGNRVVESNFKMFQNNSEGLSYIDDIKNGIIEENIYAPDIIGTEGNQEVGDIKNVVPNGYDMNPVSMEDYQNYADNANNNTENGDIGQSIQGEQFDDLIDSLLVEPSIIPDQGVTDPDVPDRPLNPEQPDIGEKPIVDDEDIQSVLDATTTPDLRSVFPFCIPFDIYAIFTTLKYEGREAPVIIWTFPDIFGNGDGWTIIIDMSPFDSVASLLRKLELMAFCVGLAVATRSLIGAL